MGTGRSSARPRWHQPPRSAPRTRWGTSVMNGRGKSDSSVVPGKSPNKAGEDAAAEAMEGRGLAKGNADEADALRTQGREGATSGLERVRRAAKEDRKQRFTALLHHVYDVDRLRAAYQALGRDAAAGVDGMTWRLYGEDLENRLPDLSSRIQRGAYRASPVRRVFIEKTDGRLRPLGVPTLEDKIVQRAVVEVLNAIYETDFLGFSYGFRPGRSPHQALDALTVGICDRRVNWVIDADIRSFFDTLKHEWLVRFVEHRIADKRVVRLIQKWLRAGVLEDGVRTMSEVGTVQGGSISPLLANLYLHYVFDLWVQKWRGNARGDVVVVRFADDFVVGFEHQDEAERFLSELRERFAQFGLELHPDKTRLIEFGRHAARAREQRGEGKPSTFDFLGFTHACGRTRAGRFKVLRHTARKRLQAKLREVAATLRERMHWPVPEVGTWLGSVVRGHVRYFGVPDNGRAINSFRHWVGWHWLRAMRRRSQVDRTTWDRMKRTIARWLPPAKICHLWPHQRLAATTQGRSRMR